MIKSARQAPFAILDDEEATAAFGRLLGDAAQRGDVIFLRGDLGAGKTSLARAAIRQRLTAPEDVPSPTFTIVQQYETSPPIWHVDLYRIGDESEIIEIGLEEAFSEAICLIEWPDRLGALTPSRRLEITLTMLDDNARRCEWVAHGEGWAHIATSLGGEA